MSEWNRCRFGHLQRTRLSSRFVTAASADPTCTIGPTEPRGVGPARADAARPRGRWRRGTRGRRWQRLLSRYQGCRPPSQPSRRWRVALSAGPAQLVPSRAAISEARPGSRTPTRLRAHSTLPARMLRRLPDSLDLRTARPYRAGLGRLACGLPGGSRRRQDRARHRRRPDRRSCGGCLEYRRGKRNRRRRCPRAASPASPPSWVRRGLCRPTTSTALPQCKQTS